MSADHFVALLADCTPVLWACCLAAVTTLITMVVADDLP